MSDYIYKLIASDIDGTLLNSKSRLSETTIDAVKKAVDNGIIFCLASGRSPFSQSYTRDSLGLAGMPVIAYNGALVTVPVALGQPGSQKVIYDQKLSYEDALRIMMMGEENDTTMFIWSDKLYINRVNEKTENYSRLADTKPVLSMDYKYMAEQGVIKIIWDDDPEVLKVLEANLPSDLSKTVNYFTSCPFFLEFVDTNVSKGIALKKLAEYYNIPRAEVLAFGDDRNDISMIEYAGCGVAMGNGIPQLKATADHITLTNDENGVASFIEKLIK